jgi:hypothetical protein
MRTNYALFSLVLALVFSGACGKEPLPLQPSGTYTLPTPTAAPAVVATPTSCGVGCQPWVSWSVTPGVSRAEMRRNGQVVSTLFNGGLRDQPLSTGEYTYSLWEDQGAGLTKVAEVSVAVQGQ